MLSSLTFFLISLLRLKVQALASSSLYSFSHKNSCMVFSMTSVTLDGRNFSSSFGAMMYVGWCTSIWGLSGPSPMMLDLQTRLSKGRLGERRREKNGLQLPTERSFEQ